MVAYHIIKSSLEIGQILKEGSKAHSPLITLFIRETPDHRDPMGRVAFIAGKRLGNAVWRNRSKRVMRAAFQQANINIGGLDVVCMAKPGTFHAKSQDVCAEIVRLLRNVSQNN